MAEYCKNNHELGVENTVWNIHHPGKPRERQCRLCNNAKSQKHRDTSSTINQYWRDRKLKELYGLTREQVQTQFDKQEGKCLGCGLTFDPNHHSTKPCVDHCHKTKVFRGLLCHSCNRGIGLLKESIATMQQLIAYLTHAEQKII
jgi:recombination endonuclease VII